MTRAAADNARIVSAAPRRWWRGHGAFLVSAALCVAAFAWMLTFGTGRIFSDDSFANFYDYQAQAWLHGRWDVPEPALGGEAFVVDGKVYGYFGPTPSLQRLPFIALGLRFGQWTRPMMLADYAACLLAAYLIVRDASTASLRRSPPNWLVIVFTLSVGLGSTLFFLGSRAYVYHEAILCGAAFGLWSAWFALRWLRTPGARWWIAALAAGVLAVHARPPAGLFALALLGLVALRHTTVLRRWRILWVAVLAGLGLLSFDALGYIKFGTFDGCPLRFHVQYTPQRLAAIDGRNFHLSNVRFNAACYLWRPAVSVRPHFPYVFLEYLDRKQYPESKIDYRDPTLALPYAMPTLVFLAIAGAFAAAFRFRALWPEIGLVWLSALPLFAAMLTAIAVTQRYTADFCVFLIPAAARGAFAVLSLPGMWRHAGKAALLAMTFVGAVVQGAITLHNQRAVVWGVPRPFQQEYQSWQRTIDSAVDNAFQAAPRATEPRR